MDHSLIAPADILEKVTRVEQNFLSEIEDIVTKYETTLHISRLRQHNSDHVLLVTSKPECWFIYGDNDRGYEESLLDTISTRVDWYASLMDEIVSTEITSRPTHEVNNKKEYH